MTRFLHIGMDGMNLPLFKRFLGEGILPTFEKLVARGTLNRLLPSIAAWTPTNWAAQVTGAHPGTHGLGGWSRHHRRDPLTVPPIESWEFREWQAETVWQVAEEAGYRVLITNYPVATWPSPVKNGYVVAPGFRYPPFVVTDPGLYYASPAVQSRGAGAGRSQRSRTVDEVEEGAPPGAKPLPLRLAQGWQGLNGQAWEAELSIPLKSGDQQTFYLLFYGARLTIHAEKDVNRPLVLLPKGQWSPFVFYPFGPQGIEASIRFRLLCADSGPRIQFCHSQAYQVHGFTYPAGLAEEIVANVGPFFTSFTAYPHDDPTLGAFLADVSYQGHWEARVADYVNQKYGWDLHFCHWHIFDNINHPTVNHIDPDGPDYDPEKAAWNLEAQRRCYVIADEVLAEFLKLADDDTVVMVVSDHAMPPAHRWADIDARLVETGLMVMDPATRKIDMSKSPTYTWPGRGAEIFINLQGREPTGVVPPEEYTEVQDRILDAMLDWKDPATGKRVMALALRLEDAQIIGYWGEDNGDVICVFNHGMGWGAVDGGASVGPGKGALHGSQVPSYETEMFTTMGMMVLAGPGVRQGGYERDWRRWGLIREIDVASTICHLMGLRPPRQNQGVLPYDLLADR
ncbi:MAG: alkaline phosphatase family protein [Chloroflexi bacterium]|nr:alkaline phosphatase family protein [Chloroflexota bacterium]